LNHPLAEKASVTLKEVSPYDLILPSPSLTTWRMVDLVFRQHELTFRSNLEAGGWEVIKRYVEMGMGVSIVTDLCLTGNEKLVRYPMDSYFPKRTYGMVLRRGKYLSPQARKFIEIMGDYYATGK